MSTSTLPRPASADLGVADALAAGLPPAAGFVAVGGQLFDGGAAVCPTCFEDAGSEHCRCATAGVETSMDWCVCGATMEVTSRRVGPGHVALHLGDWSTPACPDGSRHAVETEFAARRRLARTVVCPMPRCRAPIGADCRTPNGYAALHSVRVKAAAGTPSKVKPRRHRLTDAQAQRIETAAEHGRIFAADQYGTLRGDAADRACADALLRAGLVEQARVLDSGERELRLTADGWRAYWHHRLVIRRLPEERHAETCPCATAGSTS